MTTTLNPGTTLAAAHALRTRRGGTWTDEQVAYLIHLAYQSGRAAAAAEDLAETVACWQQHLPPQVTREQRVQARLAQMEAAAGPATYRGGPVDWDTGRPAQQREAA